MKYFNGLAVLILLIGCQNNSKLSVQETNIQSHPEENFTFSTWITYDDKKSDEAYRTEFKTYYDNGITEVLVNTLANAESLERLVPLAKAENVKLHAWIMTINRPNDEEALKHPQWYMVSRQGKSCYDNRPYVDYYQWLCPTQQDSKNHIFSLIENLAKVEGIESVHLDYIRYPDIYLPVGLLPNYNLVQNEELPQFDFCYCDACVSEFEKLHHKNPREFENPAIDIEWKQFRYNKIRDIVNKAYTIAHKGGKKLTAAVFPYPEMAGQMVRQRWDKWDVDAVYPMIYHHFYDEGNDWVGFATNQSVTDLYGTSTQVITGIYVPPLSADDLQQVISLARQSGAKGVSFYDGAALTEQQLAVIKELAKSYKK